MAPRGVPIDIARDEALHTSNASFRSHRIRLEVSSSSFPRYSRNTNTGNVPELDASFIRAEQTVYHDRARPSQLILSVRHAGSTRR